MYLIQVNKTGNAIQDDGAYAVKEFQEILNTKSLGSKALLWVALICDYDSPYKHFVEKERERIVSKDLYGTYEWKGSKNEKIADAISKYRAMQFDPLDAQLVAFNEKIDEFTSLMKRTRITIDNAADMQKVMIGIEKILGTRQKVLDSIERRGERAKIVGQAELSYLEKTESVNIKNG
jgi:hypothetical protein|tara:strand:+ start:1669 stop:2202 length:534 start_codon:yes stop_codon:yes gene_type:complete